jgi:agmatine/peptidylarginine deiminase
MKKSLYEKSKAGGAGLYKDVIGRCLSGIGLWLLLFSLTAQSQPNTPVNPWTPPEFFPTKGVLVEWDFNQNTWLLYSDMIRACREATEVILVVRDVSEENDISNLLINDGVPLSNISFVHVPCERMWIRDHGPLAVWTDHGVAFIDFDDLANSGLDENLPTNLANIWGLDSYQLPYVFCGGNFMVDSHNTLFTTDRLYTNNPGYTPVQVRDVMETFMGITSVVTVSAQHNDFWGHIDMQIKLLDDTTFVVASVGQASGPNYDTLENNYLRLASLTAPHGKPYRIRRIPMADHWKTYVNSLILNNTLLIPTYNHPYDSIAFATYKELLPNHQLVGINCNSIIGWEGALHCITMQLFDDSLVNAVKELSVKDQSVSFFPNPIARNQPGTLLWSNDYGDDLVLKIINTEGKVVQQVGLAHLKPPLILAWDQPAGVYALKLYSARGISGTIQVISVD